jgi:LysM repeat protein
MKKENNLIRFRHDDKTDKQRRKTAAGKRTFHKIAAALSLGAIITFGSHAEAAHACDYAVYEVKQGDTYWSLAAKYGVTVKQLQEANGQKPLKSGRTIVVPPSEQKQAEQEVILKGNAVEQEDGSIHYEVVKGDTLAQIARAFCTTVEHVQAVNYLRSSHIDPGQVLTLVHLDKTEVKKEVVSITGAADPTSIEVQTASGQHAVLRASASAVKEIGLAKEGTKAEITYTDNGVPTLVAYHFSK